MGVRVLSFVWKSLRYRPTRSLIALLQAALGALVVTLALALAFAQGRAATSSSDLTMLTAGNNSGGGHQFIWTFLPNDLPKLQQLAPDVQQLEVVGGEVYFYIEVGQARYRLFSNETTGPNYARLTGLKLLHGSYFTRKEMEAEARVAVISANLAQALFGREDAVGKTMKLDENIPGLRPEPYRIIGISEAAGADPNGIARPLFTPRSGVKSPVEAMKLLVLARPGRLTEAKAQLLSAAQQLYRDNYDLKVLRDEGKAGFYYSAVDDQLGDGTRFVNLPLLRSYYAIAALTLTVSGLGVLSALLVGIHERTRELGLRRAIGATRGQIVASLLLETLLTTLAGSLIGVLLAVVLVSPLNGLFGALLPHAQLEVTPGLAAFIVGLFLGLNLLFGLVPALLSTRMRPTEALRTLG